jgi:AbrB family looped-hinge helix DNA binding protein
MKVTTKGQVTIPQEFREQLGIQPGAEVEFSIEGDGLRLTPVKKATENARKLVQRLRGSASLGMTTDEIMALTRGEA